MRTATREGYAILHRSTPGGLLGSTLGALPTSILAEPQSWWVGSAGPFIRQSCPEMVLITRRGSKGPELRLKQGGRIWDFHKYDGDPWPSRPHGHDVEDRSKLSLSDGLIYD
jgi:hypothetical protein